MSAPCRPRSLPLLLLAAAALMLERPRAVHGLCRGALSADVAGQSQVYVTGQGATPSGSSLQMDHNDQISITSQCLDNWDPGTFTSFKLIGQTLSFTVDLGAVGCACNLAFYLIQEPAKDDQGVPSEGDCFDSPYYCDANQVCGQWCTELDIMEANSHVFATTAHKCDASDTAQVKSCDRGGIGRNTRDMGANVFGPAASNKIDTTQPFEVHVSFYGNPSVPTFTGMTTQLKQAGRVLEMANQAPPEYFEAMAGPLQQGMALRITYWGSTHQRMDWLDAGVCGIENCAKADAGTAHFSDIRSHPIGAPPAPPPVPVPPQEPQRYNGTAILILGIGLLMVAMAANQSRDAIIHTLHGLQDSLQGQSSMYSSLTGYAPCLPSAPSQGRGRAASTTTEEAEGRSRAATVSTEGDEEWDAPMSDAKRRLLDLRDQVVDVAQRVFEILVGHTITATVVLTRAARTCMSYIGDIHSKVKDKPITLAVLQEAVRDASQRSDVRREIRNTGWHFEVGDKVMVKNSFVAYGGVKLTKGDVGTVQKQKVEHGHQYVSVDIDFAELRRVTLTDRQSQEQLDHPNEVHTNRRRSAIVTLVALAVVLMLVLLHACGAFGGRSQGPPLPVIPPGGCCSWDGASCGSTTEYCQRVQQCNTDCKGQWILPPR